MRRIKISGFWIILFLINTLICYSQANNYSTIVDSIASKIKRLTGYKYDISGMDMNNALTSSSEEYARIHDPYNTLLGCFIFHAADITDDILTRPKSFVGIYKVRTDSIIWRSVLLSAFFTSGSVEETNEINKDGKVEIIFVQAKEPVGTIQLWIFSWDGVEGKLITELDRFGESTIMEYGEPYYFKDIDGDSIYEIQGEWYVNEDSTTKETITYAWNGHLYGKWGKSSKYLLKGKKK